MSQPISINADDAIEIAEALQWLRDWFASDPELARSMRSFSYGLISLAEISAELDDFAWTLGHRP